LLYGNHKTDFVDWIEQTNALGKKEITKEIYEGVVAEEIYLNLQDDEIEFTQEIFREVYHSIIEQYNLSQNIDIQEFTRHESPLIAQLATDILMEEDKYVLGNWESRNVYVHTKEESIAKQVTDIILNMRRVLIEKKVRQIMKENRDNDIEKEHLEEINNYTRLKKLIFEKLHRVV
jgi:DNA primase